MSGESTILERLRFNMIDHEAVTTLREAKPFILAELPLILELQTDEYWQDVTVEVDPENRTSR